ncbi:hypothetical protein AB6A40_009424 [Gnathostoma spinigerum]|uniref:Uncharacterized protein n=1 Tax=Gnathostoma spinigerum TaxID=75299 RepID=A0ABD6ERX8_9BILA
MSMKIWTGIQDFLGLHDPIATFTTSSVSNSISTITATVTAGGDGEQSSAVIVGDHRISASPTITTISDESTSCSSSSSTTPNSALKKRTLAELNDEFSRGMHILREYRSIR